MDLMEKLIQQGDAFLQHHGIKGQKWGVRNGPPYPLSRSVFTGKSLKKYLNKKFANSTRKEIDKMISRMTKDDKDKVLASNNYYLTKKETEKVQKRIVARRKGKIIGVFDIFEPESDNTINVSFAVANDKNVRRKGVATKMTEKAIKWMDNNPELKGKTIVWGVRTDNIASIKIARKNGFKLDKASFSKDKRWVNYTRKIKT